MLTNPVTHYRSIINPDDYPLVTAYIEQMNNPTDADEEL